MILPFSWFNPSQSRLTPGACWAAIRGRRQRERRGSSEFGNEPGPQDTEQHHRGTLGANDEMTEKRGFSVATLGFEWVLIGFSWDLMGP